MGYGTLSTFDTLASNYQSVAGYGEDRLWEESIQPMLDAHNRIMADMMRDLGDTTTDRQRRYGTTDVMKMTKTDEFGRPDAQKVAVGAVAGFPLDSYQGTIQWTRKYFQNATVSEFTGQVQAMMDGDVQQVILEVKRALFTPTNYTFQDYLVDRVDIPVKALLNADGAGIPVGPNGETFDGSTHTHYLGTGSFVEANLTSLQETVLEHYGSGECVIYINRAQEATVRGFTGFTKVEHVNITPSDNTARVFSPRLNAVQIYNRLIGYFNGAEVWVKPWVPASYVVAFLRGQGKVLAIRSRTPDSNRLVLNIEDEKYPLRARTYEREFGVGVWNRPAGAVLYTGNATYSAPSLPA